MVWPHAASDLRSKQTAAAEHLRETSNLAVSAKFVNVASTRHAQDESGARSSRSIRRRRYTPQPRVAAFRGSTLGHGRQHARIPRRGFTKGRNHDDSAIPSCETPSAYWMDGEWRPRVRRETRRPWAAEYNRFAVKRPTDSPRKWAHSRNTYRNDDQGILFGPFTSPASTSAALRERFAQTILPISPKSPAVRSRPPMSP